MAKRKLTRRQQDRVRRIQEARLERGREKTAAREQALSDAGLGAERPGRVVANFGKALVVEDEGGELHRCVPRQNLETLVAGDRVVWQAARTGEGVVAALVPRTSLLSRPDVHGRAGPIAANVDQILVVIAPRPEPSEVLVDRYLVAAEAFGIHPLILVNKVDLLDEAARAELDRRFAPYEAIGHHLLHASSRTAHGLEELTRHLTGKTSVLVGQSGVGKSSLVKALLPDRDIRVGALSSATGQGMHTTTATTLYRLPGGGELIDSPGVWDFALWHIDPEQVAAGFLEFRPYLGKCRFADCAHRAEPGCALKAAVEAGAIAPRRLASYHEIIDSLKTD